MSVLSLVSLSQLLMTGIGTGQRGFNSFMVFIWQGSFGFVAEIFFPVVGSPGGLYSWWKCLLCWFSRICALFPLPGFGNPCDSGKAVSVLADVFSLCIPFLCDNLFEAIGCHLVNGVVCFYLTAVTGVGPYPVGPLALPSPCCG